jgi:hypothetical protein
MKVYRVVDDITADRPTYRVAETEAQLRRDGSLKIRAFHGLTNVIIAAKDVGRLVHVTPEAARAWFAVQQRRRIELAHGEIAAGEAALAWALAASS